MIEIQNAIITDATITTEDHGLLTVWITLDYGNCSQGFGGYPLYLPRGFTHHKTSGPDYAGHFIWRVMEVAGVTRWQGLAGKTVRVKSEHSILGDLVGGTKQVHAIGHIVKDDWFNPTEDFGKMEAKEG